MPEFKTDWEVTEPKEIKEYLHHTSTSYFDNIVDPTTTANDRKNMRIRGAGTTNNGGGGGQGCVVKIDPDETNKLQNREKGLYVPPILWEKLT